MRDVAVIESIVRRLTCIRVVNHNVLENEIRKYTIYYKDIDFVLQIIADCLSSPPYNCHWYS
jgi:hypothetical protein